MMRCAMCDDRPGCGGGPVPDASHLCPFHTSTRTEWAAVVTFADDGPLSGYDPWHGDKQADD